MDTLRYTVNAAMKKQYDEVSTFSTATKRRIALSKEQRLIGKLTAIFSRQQQANK